MGKRRSFITPLHTKTTRDYLGRMNDDKVHCMEVARKYEKDYWDGDRRYGYGGYRYDGRWRPVAEKMIKTYKLSQNAKILDVGCGKGHLLYEFTKLLPQSTVAGFDVSKWGLSHAKEEVKSHLFRHRAEDSYPFKDNEFDLVYTINTLHNLMLPKLKTAISEIERVGKNKFIEVESYRNEKELFNLQCWALTCDAFFNVESWKWMFREFGYSGDYEFIYFE